MHEYTKITTVSAFFAFFGQSVPKWSVKKWHNEDNQLNFTTKKTQKNILMIRWNSSFYANRMLIYPIVENGKQIIVL